MNERRPMTRFAGRLPAWPGPLALALGAAVLHGQQPARETVRDYTIRRFEPTAGQLAHWQALRKCRPPTRGFRLLLPDPAADPWPLDQPAPDAPAAIRDAASLVGQRLARDGLLATTAAAIERSGPSSLPREPGARARLLRTIGLPIDWLAYFAPPDEPSASIVDWICARLSEGRSVESLRSQLAAVPLRFRPSRPGFIAADEMGETPLSMLRLQLPSVQYARGPGDGSPIDVARQLVQSLRDVRYAIVAQESDIDGLCLLLREWQVSTESVQIVSQPLPVDAWAQDNGKAGLIPAHDRSSGSAGVSASRRADREGEAATEPRPATLAPRYACRGEESTLLAVGESMALASLADAGHTVFQSPLLFQGGNLMVVREPRGGKRTLLIGEAEVYRNTALGLTEDQVLEAFRIELAVDRCVILPAVSFHIDFEFCPRVVDGRLVAFVNDPLAAARALVKSGLPALRAAGCIDDAAVKQAQDLLAQSKDAALLELLAPRVQSKADPAGGYPPDLARPFAANATDSPEGNFRLFLLAMDVLGVEAGRAEPLPADPFIRDYLLACRRRDEDRRTLHQRLIEVGFDLVPVPGIAEEDRGISYVNALHDRERFIVPAYGGLYAELDAAAAAVYAKTLGPKVEIIPVLCAETQRLLGAVHCMAAAYPKQ
jgi:hypothetical protein